MTPLFIGSANYSKEDIVIGLCVSLVLVCLMYWWLLKTENK